MAEPINLLESGKLMQPCQSLLFDVLIIRRDLRLKFMRIIRIIIRIIEYVRADALQLS